jgi:hypothetical protein
VRIVRSRLNALDWVALVLTVVGAINWGLVGFFNFDLVRAIFGLGITGTAAISTLSRIIFAVIGVSGLYAIYSLWKIASMPAGMAMEERERMRRAA